MPKVSKEYSAARRQQIIDAAYRCFARKGFHQSTMRDIYEEAQLSPGAVYNYFSGKDAIVQASFEGDSQRSAAIFANAMASDDPLQAIRELAAFFFTGLESAAALGAGRVNVQSWGEALVNPVLHETINGVQQTVLGQVGQLARRAQEYGQIAPDMDAQAIGRVLLALYYGLELQMALDPDVNVNNYAKAVDGMLAALAHKGK
jgi:AcrR family transcriptional regulator